MTWNNKCFPKVNRVRGGGATLVQVTKILGTEYPFAVGIDELTEVYALLQSYPWFHGSLARTDASGLVLHPPSRLVITIIAYHRLFFVRNSMIISISHESLKMKLVLLVINLNTFLVTFQSCSNKSSTWDFCDPLSRDFDSR